MITPAVGGAFGAKFGADRGACAGRVPGAPAGPSGDLGRDPLGEHGRDVARPGAGADGHHRRATATAGSPRTDCTSLQDSGAYPKFGGMLPTLTRLMAPGVYDIEHVESSFAASSPTRPRSAPTAAPGVPRRPRRSSARSTCSPPRSAWTRPRCAAATCCRRSPSRSPRKGGAQLRLRRLPDGARERRSPPPTTRGCVPSRRPGANGATPCSSASACRSTSRSPAAAANPGRPARTPPSRCTPTAARRSSPAPRRTGRVTPRCGRCSSVTSSASRSTRSPSSGATPTSCRRAAAPAVRAACSRAARRCSQASRELDRRGQAAGRRRARGRPGRPGRRRRAGRARRARRARRSGVSFADARRRARAQGAQRVQRAPDATYPFGAHVAVVEVDVETGKARLRKLFALDDAGTIINPLIAEGQRHGGLAQGAAQALLEEVLFDEDGNPTTNTLAVLPDRLGHRAAELRSGRRPRPRRRTTLWARKASARPARSASTPAVQNAVDRRGGPSGRAAHRHADQPDAGVDGHQRCRAEE